VRLNRLHSESQDISDDLARTLPRWIGWVPVIGKAGYRRYAAMRARNSIDAMFRIEPLYCELYIPDKDSGVVTIGLLAINFSKKVVEVDRAELHSIQVGSRGISRTSEMLKAHTLVAPRSTANIYLGIDLFGADVRNAGEGVTVASNPKSAPSVNVRFHLTLVLHVGSKRIRRNVEGSLDPRRCFVFQSPQPQKAK
jgi:hypothetical protein